MARSRAAPSHSPRERADHDLLRAMIESISGELDLEPLLQRIIACACELIGADDGAIGLVNPRGTAVRTAATHRMPADEVGREVAIGRGLYGAVLASRAPVLARYGDLPGFVDARLADNRVLGVPIVWQQEVLGVLGIGAHPPRDLGPAQLDLALTFSRHAAIAIANARRFQRERRRRTRFELVARVAALVNSGPDLRTRLQQVADAIHQVLGFPNVDIPLVDPEDPGTLVVSIRGGHYKQAIRQEDRLPIEVGVMGAAVRERRAQRVDDVSRDSRYVRPPVELPAGSELAIPILFGEEVLGVLNVEGSEPFDDLDQVTLEIIAEHLAAAIENDRLLERQREAAISSERERLARDLHDSVTQLLSSISLTAQSLEAVIRGDPAEAERRATRLVELTQMAFGDMRALLHELSPLPRRLPQAATSLAQLAEGGGFRVALERMLAAMLPPHIEARLDCGRYVPQPPAVEGALLRIVLEALSNAVRHSRADRVEVRTRTGRRYLELSISDNGIGLPRPLRHGLGLQSMRTRARELGGRLRVGRAPPRGTRIAMRVPLSG
jgi:signal transduction histidine kinase